jgi:hypothetical protein
MRRCLEAWAEREVEEAVAEPGGWRLELRPERWGEAVGGGGAIKPDKRSRRSAIAQLEGEKRKGEGSTSDYL